MDHCGKAPRIVLTARAAWDVDEDDMSAMGAMYAYEMAVRELEEMV
mgnify:CR=1 FL=1